MERGNQTECIFRRRQSIEIDIGNQSITPADFCQSISEIDKNRIERKMLSIVIDCQKSIIENNGRDHATFPFLTQHRRCLRRAKLIGNFSLKGSITSQRGSGELSEYIALVHNIV